MVMGRDVSDRPCVWKEKGIACSTEPRLYHKLLAGVLGCQDTVIVLAHTEQVMLHCACTGTAQHMHGKPGPVTNTRGKFGCHEHMEATLHHMEWLPIARAVNLRLPCAQVANQAALERGSGTCEQQVKALYVRQRGARPCPVNQHIL